MRDLIWTRKPDVMVEIGVFAGKSLVNAAEALKVNGHGVIYGIDPWRHEEAVKGLSPIEEDPGFWNGIDLDAVHYDCMRAIWDRGLEEYAVVIRSASQHAHQLFRTNPIDILYIDGGHSKEVSTLDVNLYVPKVKSGGYIWIDDADWSSIRKATQLLKDSCELQNDYGHCQLYKKP
jgi:predicted O-methyltransferase YrrM